MLDRLFLALFSLWPGLQTGATETFNAWLSYAGGKIAEKLVERHL